MPLGDRGYFSAAMTAWLLSSGPIPPARWFPKPCPEGRAGSTHGQRLMAYEPVQLSHAYGPDRFGLTHGHGGTDTGFIERTHLRRAEGR